MAKKAKRLRAKANSWKRVKQARRPRTNETKTVSYKGGYNFQWNKKGGLKGNYESLGLNGDVNEGTHYNEAISGPLQVKKPRAIENEAVTCCGASALITEREPAPIMPLHKQVYWSELILKHGSDYKAMERDVKLNSALYTETKCKKMCELYMEQMAAPILPSAMAGKQ